MAIGLRFDGAKVAFDMTAKGWVIADLATHSGLSGRTIYRFINNEAQTTRTAKAISAALGFSIRRYLIGVVEAVAS